MSLSSSDLTGVMYAVRNTMKKRNDVGVWAATGGARRILSNEP
jgi:hypothetical protein